MAKITVCTVAHEGARAYLSEWLDSVIRESSDFSGETNAFIILDGLTDSQEFCSKLARHVPTECVEAAPGTPAKMRATLLRHAPRLDADALVILDADDVFAPRALSAHWHTLAGFDVSYGDIQPIDAQGGIAGPPMFEGVAVPATVSSPAAIYRRNFLGFGNSAIRCSSLTDRACAIPDNVTATDWWFFTILLQDGRRGACANQTVTHYRMHEQNILGARPNPSITAVLRRCEIVRQHYSALPDYGAIAEYDSAVSCLANELVSSGADMADAIAHACEQPGVWFDDIARLTDSYLPKAQQSHVI